LGRLNRVGVNRKEPWSLIGDFNEILSNSEKSGGPWRPESSFKPFAEMLKICGMEELSSRGDRFTWGGTRWKKYIRCCLDRCFANNEWSKLFPGANQSFLEKRGSDHRPVFVRLRASNDVFRGRFCFDKRSLFHADVKKEVKMSWKRSNMQGRISEKIRNCRKVLSCWKKRRSFNAKDKINILQDRLEWLQSRSYPCAFAVRNTMMELIQAYKEEEVFWRQKSKDKWLLLGDRNSKFFHSSVKSSRSRKNITKLKDEQGNEQWSDAAKAEVALEYFRKLFASSNPRSNDPVF